MFRFKHLIIFIIFWAINLSAEEHGSAPAGNAEAVDKQFSGRQDENWTDIQSKLGVLKSKVEAQKSVVEEILKNKKNSEAKISKKEIDQLKIEHEKLKSITNDYNKMLANFQFRFPEKGLESGRKYIRIENQSLEEMETPTTFEGRLKKLNRKIKKQYQVEEQAPTIIHKKPTVPPVKTPVGSKSLDSKKTNEADVTDPIDLVK